jgi:hypothetical protein
MEGKIVDETQPKLERAKRYNPFNYTDEQFAIRDKAVRDMNKDHPKIPYKYLEWLYDTITNMPEDKVDNIIKNNLWDEVINTTRKTGGTIENACEIITAETNNEDVFTLVE